MVRSSGRSKKKRRKKSGEGGEKVEKMGGELVAGRE